MKLYTKSIRSLKQAAKAAEEGFVTLQQIVYSRQKLTREELIDIDRILNQLNYFLAKNDSQYALLLEDVVKKPVRPVVLQK